MGNDAKFYCFDCDNQLYIGRAYRFNKENINKKVPKETYEQLKLAVERFNMTLKKIEIFNEDSSFDLFEGFEGEIAFLKEHQEHDVWLIDDYFEEKK